MSFTDLKNKRVTYSHAFDFYYKWCPTGSNKIVGGWPNNMANVNEDWDGQNRSISNAYYNNAIATSLDFDTLTALTREPAIISGSAGALPWGSPAADYLWNCLVPTQSGFSIDSTARGGGSFNNTMIFTFTYNSASFFRGDLRGDYGFVKYPITSSWKAVEPLMTASNMIYKTFASSVGGGTVEYPATINKPTPSDVYAQPSAFSAGIPKYTEVGGVTLGGGVPLANGTNPGMITFGDASTGSFDGRFYDLAGGIGISRQDVSASLAGYASQSHLQTSAVQINLSNELKRRRLFFPTVTATRDDSITADPSSGVNWFCSDMYPLPNPIQSTGGIFNTNGGIFNVKFNLKRNLNIDMYPDTGAGSELLIYIFNIQPNVGLINERVAGTAGFYPPDNNIVRIKNVNPAMSFINPATGFQLESFNINVVQYGLDAQIVFEASGSLDSDSYFGCIIDDIEFCQVGVATDPSLLAPTTIGGNITNEVAFPADRS